VVDSEHGFARRGFHVGLICDGVRRWARAHSVTLDDAYFAAAPRVAAFVDYFFAHGATAISIYALSRENLLRDVRELAPVIAAETQAFHTLIRQQVLKWRCEVRVAGNRDLLPTDYLRALTELQLLPHDASKRLYVLAAYDPLDELRQALAGGIDGMSDHLWVPESVDLVVRTSGEHRISNFLPLQSGYAELCFLDMPINDLTVEDCAAALDSYERRDRRYGR
jgi:undecaprenyl diphosphate synthase